MTKVAFFTTCRDASMMSMRRKIKGKSPEEIREMKREELDLPVTIQDFEEAIVRHDQAAPLACLEIF